MHRINWSRRGGKYQGRVACTESTGQEEGGSTREGLPAPNQLVKKRGEVPGKGCLHRINWSRRGGKYQGRVACTESTGQEEGGKYQGRVACTESTGQEEGGSTREGLPAPNQLVKKRGGSTREGLPAPNQLVKKRGEVPGKGCLHRINWSRRGGKYQGRVTCTESTGQEEGGSTREGLPAPNQLVKKRGEVPGKGCLHRINWSRRGGKYQGRVTCTESTGQEEGGSTREGLPAPNQLVKKRGEVPGKGCLHRINWSRRGGKYQGRVACTESTGQEEGGSTREGLPAPNQLVKKRGEVPGKGCLRINWSRRGGKYQGRVACTESTGQKRGGKYQGRVACTESTGQEEGGSTREGLPAPNQLVKKRGEVPGKGYLHRINWSRRGGKYQGRVACTESTGQEEGGSTREGLPAPNQLVKKRGEVPGKGYLHRINWSRRGGKYQGRVACTESTGQEEGGSTREGLPAPNQLVKKRGEVPGKGCLHRINWSRRGGKYQGRVACTESTGQEEGGSTREGLPAPNQLVKKRGGSTREGLPAPNQLVKKRGEVPGKGCLHRINWSRRGGKYQGRVACTESTGQEEGGITREGLPAPNFVTPTGLESRPQLYVTN